MIAVRRIVLPLLAALALASVLAACGSEGHSKEVVEGQPVELGELKYNVIFSRYLNPSDSEDSAYLVGQPTPPPGSSYFGIFFIVQNESKEPQPLPGSLTIVDADHSEFEALPSESRFALPLGGEVEAEEQVPVLDSPAAFGPIEGSLATFLLPDFVSENRPLILEIPGPEGPAEVTLDL
jgi:hypothetical protein